MSTCIDTLMKPCIYLITIVVFKQKMNKRKNHFAFYPYL